MTLRALLIEDDETIADPLVEGLGRYGLTVRHVTTGAAGLHGPYGDIVLLDLGLPDMDGIDVCRGIRQLSAVPVIMLTARGTEADRVLGLELGADDYLAKPFSIRELIARIRAVTRRSGAWAGGGPGAAGGLGGVPGPLGVEVTHGPVGAGAFPYPVPMTPAPPTPAHAPPTYPEQPAWQDPPVPTPPPAPAPEAAPPLPGALIVDRRTRQVWIGERPVALTPKEFDLLALLTEDPGAVYSRQQILDRVWDPHFHGPTKTLDVHVATLRRKLGDPAWIQTLRGVGLRLAVRTGASPSVSR
ncbi:MULTISPECIES: response regulator transcription factor [unclassified Streptomyces]|uniref:response regulator transcription factor n=1 Tax=unclassified Streptomyces TaxID=2593676 RepID=UPI002E2D8670|nr:response regulator transcription factor [Streptomyces sp. NBC_01429]